MVFAVLYFAMGFALAGLLAIILAPIAVRRAVKLTRRQVEASLPISVDEIRAEKDKVRAELAVVVRRLEMDLDQAKRAKVRADVKTHRAEQAKVEASDKYEAILKEFGGIKARLGKASAALFDLEKDHKGLKAELADNVAHIATKTAELADEQARASDLEMDIASVQEQLGEAEATLKAEQKALKTTADELRETRALLKTVQADLRTSERNLRAAEKQQARAEARAAKLDERLLSRSLTGGKSGTKNSKAQIVSEALEVQNSPVKNTLVKSTEFTPKASSMPKAAPLEVKSFIGIELAKDVSGDADALKAVMEKIGAGEAFDREDMENYLQQIAASMSADAVGDGDMREALAPFLKDAENAPKGSLARAIIDAL